MFNNIIYLTEQETSVPVYFIYKLFAELFFNDIICRIKRGRSRLNAVGIRAYKLDSTARKQFKCASFRRASVEKAGHG